MKNIQAALFDLDGTLTNTLTDIANAMNRALTEHGLPTWSVEDYKYLVGNGATILAQRAVRDRQELAEPVRQTYQAWYETHNQETTRPYDGIPAMLTALREAGLRLAVLARLLDAIQYHLNRRAAGAYRVGAVLFSNEYGLLGTTEVAEEIIREWNKNAEFSTE